MNKKLVWEAAFFLSGIILLVQITLINHLKLTGDVK